MMEEVIRQLKIDYPDKSEEELRIIIWMAGDSQQRGGLVFKVIDARPEDRLKAMVDNARKHIEALSEYDLGIKIGDIIGSSGSPRVIKKDG